MRKFKKNNEAQSPIQSNFKGRNLKKMDLIKKEMK